MAYSSLRGAIHKDLDSNRRAVKSKHCALQLSFSFVIDAINNQLLEVLDVGWLTIVTWLDAFSNGTCNFPSAESAR